MDGPAIYLDNAASTRPAPEVAAAIATAAAELYANPSSAHAAGAAAARAVEEARDAVLAAIGTDAGQLAFTSGGTEANALGLLGAAGASRGRHVVATAIEHASVLRNVERLAGGGFTTTLVPPDRDSGIVPAEAVAAALTPDTSLVAVMLVNNELGTVQPVAAIARALEAHASRHGTRRPHLHVDAVQALGQVPIRAATLGADSLALSAHKIHGGKGAGALWLRAGARLTPLWDGGRQERGLRSGTENVPAIVGFGRAAALARAALAAGGGEAIAKLRDTLEAHVLETVRGAKRTVSATGARAPHISSLCFPGLPAEPLLHALEARGVLVSAGSACASKTRGPSHVLKAVGVDDETAVLRLSLSRETTPDEIARAARALEEAVVELSAPVAGHRRRA
ncbi:MAG TPA: cysteine desulfurase family protein [Polyangia bacterium]